MIPVIVRSTEEMLKIVPNDLREASYALGVPKWKTIVRIVIPTAFGGIVTGNMMTAHTLVGRRVFQELEATIPQYEAALAIGLPALSRLIRATFPDVAVISYLEIPASKQTEIVATIGADVPRLATGPDAHMEDHAHEN